MALGTQGELLAGRYRPLRLLGSGGMARVHLAEDERLGRRVAVKQMHAHSPDDVAVRFEREAKLGASLNHPNLVSIYDIETEGESVLIVMEFVDGETLQDAIARAPLAPDRVARIVRDVASGLDHAHKHGVVHRDVKPANILIRHDGMAKLADLGIASAAEQTSITRSGIVLGTAAYMAPEQLDGGTATAASDVYALAAVAFEALSGAKARSGQTPLEIAHEVVKGPPPDLADRWPGAPPAVSSTLARGMAREPADRQPSAGALARELEHGLRRSERRPTAAAAPTAPTAIVEKPPTSRGRPSRIPAALAGLVLVIAAIAGFAALDGGGDDGSTAGERASTPSATREPADKDARSNREDATDAPSASDDAGSAAPSAREDTPTPTAAPPAPTDDPVALNDEGYDLNQAGRYEEAIPLLERAVAAFPEGSQDLTYAYALFNLGHALRMAGRPDEAVPILERRLRIPNQTETVQRELDAARAAAG